MDTMPMPIVRARRRTEGNRRGPGYGTAAADRPTRPLTRPPSGPRHADAGRVGWRAEAASPPAMIAPRFVVDLIDRADPETVRHAEDGFCRIVGVPPMRGRVDVRSRSLRVAFREWFAFDCDLGGGVTPFALTARYLRDVLRCLGRRAFLDLEEVSSTNRAAWFRVVEANAAAGRLWLEDDADGDVYAVHDRPLAARLDGTHRRMLVCRIAESRGVWRPVGTTWETPGRGPRPEDAREDGPGQASRPGRSPGRPRFVDLVSAIVGGAATPPDGTGPSSRTVLPPHTAETLWAALSREDFTRPDLPCPSGAPGR